MSRKITARTTRHLKHVCRNATDVLRVLSMDFLVLPSVANRFSVYNWIVGIRLELTIVDCNSDGSHIINAHSCVDHILHAVAHFLDLFTDVVRTASSVWLVVNCRHPANRIGAIALASLEPLVHLVRDHTVAHGHN